jgi:hypothetical protein
MTTRRRRHKKNHHHAPLCIVYCRLASRVLTDYHGASGCALTAFCQATVPEHQVVSNAPSTCPRSWCCSESGCRVHPRRCWVWGPRRPRGKTSASRGQDRTPTRFCVSICTPWARCEAVFRRSQQIFWGSPDPGSRGSPLRHHRTESPHPQPKTLQVGTWIIISHASAMYYTKCDSIVLTACAVQCCSAE